MANKIFTFGTVEEPGTAKKLPLLEKWKDISMLSKAVPFELEKKSSGTLFDDAFNVEGQSDLVEAQSSQVSSYMVPKVSKSVNVRAVRNSLHNIFTWIPGERVLLPEFGSRLYTLLYEGITKLTEEQIVAEIRSCVTEWEPRAEIVEIRNVSTVDDTEDNVIHIDVVFTIPSLDDEQYIYSFIYDVTS